MDMTDIADNLAAGTMDEDAIILNAELLEQTVDAVKAEGYSADETVGWDRLVTEVMTTSKLHTVGHLKQLNYRLAERYLELDMDALKAIHKQASRKFAAVGDWIFAKSGGEVGRVTEVISTGSPHYADVRKEYLNRYGLDQVSIYESATAMYRVVHADNSEELYYDTETSIEPSQANVSATQSEHAKVDPAVLKQAVALWWSLLPSTERQSIFARSGASLKVLDAVQARLGRATEADVEEYHPLLLSAYKHTLANRQVKTAAGAVGVPTDFQCQKCGYNFVNNRANETVYCPDCGTSDVNALEKKADYGDKRDHRKIEIFVGGEYKATTTWASTCTEAKEKYLAEHPDVDASSVSCQFKSAVLKGSNFAVKADAELGGFMAVYSVNKMVTAWGPDGADPDTTRDMGDIDSGNIHVATIEELPIKVQEKLGLEYPFEYFEDAGDEMRWDTNQVEDDDGMQNENGKWLCDYSLYATFYTAAKPPRPGKGA